MPWIDLSGPPWSKMLPRNWKNKCCPDRRVGGIAHVTLQRSFIPPHDVPVIISVGHGMEVGSRDVGSAWMLFAPQWTAPVQLTEMTSLGAPLTI